MGNAILRTFYCSVALGFIALCPITVAQTRQFLDAPVVKSHLRVRWNSSLKAMQWAADDDETFRAFPTNPLFLTKSSIYLAYHHLNPLTTQATVTITAKADPSYTNITTLLNALTSVVNTVVPGGVPIPPNQAAPLGQEAQDPCKNAVDTLEGELNKASPVNVAKEVMKWPGAIDAAFAGGSSGPQSIKAGVDAITGFGDGLDVVDAKKQLGILTQCAVTSSDNTSRAYYLTVRLDDSARMQQMTSLKATTANLAESLLKQFGAPDQWTGPKAADFIISVEVAPTFAVMQDLTTKVVTLAYKVDSSTSAISTEQQAAGSTTLSVRKYSTLATEIGVGAVFGSIKEPTYGTATNATGQMIVAKKADTAPSLNGAVLANFVCRCGTGLLVPMVQVGALASKDLPSILVGGGLRLFGLGKGDFAIGGGAMAAWYKDLDKLKVGGVVSGTNDINSDLKFISRPKIGGYVTIQYKF